MKITVLIENHAACPEDGLAAEHGLSLHIEHQGVSVLFDTGASGDFAANADRLGIDLSAVDIAVVSHHHFDHGGGLPAFFAVNDHAPVYLRPPPDGNPVFHALAVMNRDIGLPEGLVENHAERFVIVEERLEPFSGLFVIDRVHKQHPVPGGNRYLYLEKDGRRENDPFDHELMLVARSKQGLVVFTGCSHSGVLNMIETVTELFPGERIAAVVGGFHLIGFPLLDTMSGGRAQVRKIGNALSELPVDHYWTGHCTGGKAYGVLQQILGDRLSRLNTGTSIEL